MSSGRSVIASIRSSTRGLALASSASRRRCSITARASGLAKGRSGMHEASWSRSIASWPASSVAFSVSLMRAAGPDMLGQVLGGLGGVRLAAAARQGQRHLRRAIERMRVRRLRVGQLELGLGGGRAIVVVDLVVEFEGAVGGALRLADEADRGGLSGMTAKAQRPSSSSPDFSVSMPSAVSLPANWRTLERRSPAAAGLAAAACGAGRVDVARVAVLVGEGKRFLARAAGDAQRDVAALRAR